MLILKPSWHHDVMVTKSDLQS